MNIVLGGPEISYDYEEYLLNGIANFIVINEGELAFEKLIKHLSGEYNIYDVENIAYLENGIVKQNQLMQIEDLNQLKDPFFQEDIKDISKKVQYIELSRGCPYKCSYCLASLEKGLRFFNIDKVFDQIDYLVNHGARTIKFLDRSFNANKKIALSFFKNLSKKTIQTAYFNLK